MKIIRIAQLRLKTYFSGTGFIIPILVIISFCAVMYTIKPVYFVSSILLSAVLSFLLTAFISLTLIGKENEVSEQLYYLYGRDIRGYELAKHLFIGIIDLLCAFLLVSIPVIYNALNGFDLFIYPLTLEDVIGAFIIVSATALSGGILGSFFNGRIIEDRNRGLLLTVFALILSVCKVSLIEKYIWMKYILWCMPSIMYANSVFAKAEAFDLMKAAEILASLLFYNFIILLIKLFLMDKKRVSK